MTGPWKPPPEQHLRPQVSICSGQILGALSTAGNSLPGKRGSSRDGMCFTMDHVSLPQMSAIAQEDEQLG